MPLLELASAQQVHGVVMSDAQQPRQEAAAGRLVRGRLPPQLEKGLLDDLFSRGSVGQQPHRERIHTAAVPLIDQFERTGIASRDGLDQEGVIAKRSFRSSSSGSARPTATKREPDFHGQGSISRTHDV
jgi:hypothetical protein